MTNSITELATRWMRHPSKLTETKSRVLQSAAKLSGERP